MGRDGTTLDTHHGQLSANLQRNGNKFKFMYIRYLYNPRTMERN
jgi:hypothetical protein